MNRISQVRRAAASLAMLAAVSTATASAADVPSYARPAPAEEVIRGRIASFDGSYHLSLRDERGYVDAVELHQGTVISPTGARLRDGMHVSIVGYNAGRTFHADEVDAPYGSDVSYVAGPPGYVDYGPYAPVYPYPYPAYAPYPGYYGYSGAGVIVNPLITIGGHEWHSGYTVRGYGYERGEHAGAHWGGGGYHR